MSYTLYETRSGYQNRGFFPTAAAAVTAAEDYKLEKWEVVGPPTVEQVVATARRDQAMADLEEKMTGVPQWIPSVWSERGALLARGHYADE